MIEFLCPEGHKIRCPEDRAGLPAKCPRCGVKFRIPKLEELRATESASRSAVTRDGNASGDSKKPSASKENQIEFLCPNGHHLHGPASLQGKPGECPECGSRFRIPLMNEEGDEEHANEAGETGRAEITASDGSPDAGESVQTQTLSDLLDAGNSATSNLPTARLGFGESAINLPLDASALGGPRNHPLGELFDRLWGARTKGSRVEIHLAAGGILLPDGYVKSLSQRGSAVLVTKDPDDTYTITIVSWDDVSRVIMRGIREVPGEISN